MHLPLEILRLIFRHMVQDLPIKEILQARLVNHTFAIELDALIPESPALDENDFVYERRRWVRFPYKHKRRFIELKVDERQHKEYRGLCVFAKEVDKILKIPSVLNCSKKEKKDILTMMLDAIQYSRYRARTLYSRHRISSPPYHGFHSFEFESFEETLLMLRTSRAIIHSDAVGFDRLLEEEGPVDFHESVRFHIDLLDLIAKTGSKEMVDVLAKRKVNVNFDSQSSGWLWSHRLLIAANIEKKEAFERSKQQWTDDGILQNSIIKIIDWAVRRSFHFAIAHHNLDMVALLAPTVAASRAHFPGILKRAAEHGALDIVKWCLSHKNFHVFGSEAEKGALWWLIEDAALNRAAIAGLLLENGFDPNDLRRGINPRRTLLQVAVRKHDFDVAKVLVEYGADVNGNDDGPLPEGEYKDKNKPPLPLAVDVSNQMVNLLLENGASRRWWWKGREHVLGTDRRVAGHIEGVFRDLGFDGETVRCLERRASLET